MKQVILNFQQKKWNIDDQRQIILKEMKLCIYVCMQN